MADTLLCSPTQPVGGGACLNMRYGHKLDMSLVDATTSSSSSVGHPWEADSDKENTSNMWSQSPSSVECDETHRSQKKHSAKRRVAQELCSPSVCRLQRGLDKLNVQSPRIEISLDQKHFNRSPSTPMSQAITPVLDPSKAENDVPLFGSLISYASSPPSERVMTDGPHQNRLTVLTHARKETELAKHKEKIPLTVLNISTTSMHGNDMLQDTFEDTNTCASFESRCSTVTRSDYEPYSSDTIMSQEDTRDSFELHSHHGVTASEASNASSSWRIEMPEDISLKHRARSALCFGSTGSMGTALAARLPSSQSSSQSPERKKSRASSPFRLQRSRSSSDAPSVNFDGDAMDDSPCSAKRLTRQSTREIVRRLESQVPVSPPASMDDFVYCHKLPVFQDECTQECIGVSIVKEIMRGEHRHKYDKVFVIDCRFGYEFEGGHVSNNEYVEVLHIAPDQAQVLEQRLQVGENIDSSGLTINNDRVCIIFHCEFSKQRGPAMMRHIRSADRNENMHRYPALFYPELYVMCGGYKQFYLDEPQTRENFCFPIGYTPMRAEDYRSQLKGCMQHIKSKKNRSSRDVFSLADSEPIQMI